MSDPLALIEEIRLRHNVKSTAAEFHAAVNVCFHRFESEVYDELHRDMWESLPREIELLASACVSLGAPERIRMLDIGCGTGLATDSLVRSSLGPRIAEIDLLDTSTAMLSRAQKRRDEWQRPGQTVEGIVETLAPAKSYDLIITCSVLHHVPDLASFLRAVSGLQKDAPHALFLHLQDPNGDFLDDPLKAARNAEFAPFKIPESVARFKPSRILGRIKRELTGEQGQDYISKTNRELIKTGVIGSPLSVDELFTITDIHVRDGGISIERMKGWLPDYDLVTQRSYAFFGALSSQLPAALRTREDQYSRDGELNGGHNAAAWRRKD